MTQKNRQAQLFTGPVDFTGPVRFFGPVNSVNEIVVGPIVFSEFPPGAGDVVVRGPVGTDLRADSTKVAHAGSVIGVAISTGNFVCSGEIEYDGWSFVTGDTLYVSPFGPPTATPPTTGFQQRIGVASGASRLILMIGEPIILM